MTIETLTRPARSRLRRWLAAVVVAIAVLVYPVRKMVQYAADPTGPKDCPPLEPNPASGTTATAQMPGSGNLRWTQQGGTINDASCLNRTPVHGIVEIRTVDDVRNALRFAASNGLKVAAAGVKHSMGGQAFARGALVLDMRPFNRMALDEAQQVLRVDSGATWHDIQTHLPAQAEEDEVVAREDGVRQLRDDGLVVADHAGEEALAAP
jgi:hypothetical protein